MGKIPTIVVGGYLGTGKSTFLNGMLSSRKSEKIGVIVNDYAPVNVDAAYVIKHDGITLAIQDGCVCCSVSDALSLALDSLVLKRPKLVEIVLEASGVSEPDRIGPYVQGWPGLDFDGAIVVVDTTNVHEKLRDKYVGDLVKRQIAAADAIVLSKIDRCGPAEIKAATALVKSLNRDVSLFLSANGDAPFSDVIAAARSSRSAKTPYGKTRMQVAEAIPDDNSEMKTLVARSGEIFSNEIIDLIEKVAIQCERVKGVVRLSGVEAKRPDTYLLQSSNSQFEKSLASSSQTYDESVLVFIFRETPDARPIRDQITSSLSGSDWAFR